MTVSKPPSMAFKNSAIKSNITATMKRSTMRERCVSFEDTVQIIKVQPVDDSLKTELFYCRSDFKRFKQESKHISQLLDQRLSQASWFKEESKRISQLVVEAPSIGPWQKQKLLLQLKRTQHIIIGGLP